MIGSQRSYMFVRNVLFYTIGILALFVLLSFSMYQRTINNINEELERTALDLLGYIEYDDGYFLISDVNKSDANAFMGEKKLLGNGKTHFAYIWDMQQQAVIWTPLDNNKINQLAIGKNTDLFDFKMISDEKELSQQGFTPATAQKVYSVPLNPGETSKEYMAVIQKFTLNTNNNRRDCLFIVAAAIPSIRDTISSGYMNFSGLLYLILVIGLSVIVFFKTKNSSKNMKRFSNNEFTA